MRQFLELSIFSILSISLFVWPNSAQARSVKPKEAVAPIALELVPDLSFLEQAEEIEREIWWVVTQKRIEGTASPLRILRAASLAARKQNKKQIQFKFCQSLLISMQRPNLWRFEASCQKPAIELGTVEKLSSSPEKWKVIWKTGPFADHFGLSTAILFSQQSCEIELDSKKRISRMSCPQYVRDRKVSEIVEFKIFEYQAGAPKLIKIEGEVKKDLQVIANFQTEVPLSGDIVLKIKKVSQKPVEEKADISNMEQPVPTRGDPDGQENQKNKKNSQVDKKSREESREEEQSRSENREDQREEGQNPSEENRNGQNREIHNPESGEAGPNENSGEDSEPQQPVPPIAPSR